MLATQGEPAFTMNDAEPLVPNPPENDVSPKNPTPFTPKLQYPEGGQPVSRVKVVPEHELLEDTQLPLSWQYLLPLKMQE